MQQQHAQFGVFGLSTTAGTLRATKKERTTLAKHLCAKRKSQKILACGDERKREPVFKEHKPVEHGANKQKRRLSVPTKRSHVSQVNQLRGSSSASINCRSERKNTASHRA